MNSYFKQAELKLGFTIAQMALALNVPYRSYYKWSTGEQKAPAAAHSAVEFLLFISERGLLDEWLANKKPAL